MYNVLLVDDEPSHLAGLSKLLGRMRPNYKIHTAKNGEEALRACDSCDYQIIISDIQMPIMDGLKFVEKLHSRNKPLKIIFLTAYSHFEYAQKAIVLGSFEYILKPVDKENFTAVLERAEQSLEREMLQMQEQARMEGMLKSAVPVYRSRILNEWLLGAKLTEETRSELRELGLDRGGFLLIADFRAAPEADDNQRESWKLECKKSLEQILVKRGAFYTLEPEAIPYRLLAVSDTIPDRELNAKLTEFMEVSSSSGHWLSIGLSAWCEELAVGGPQLYREALLACESGFYTKECRPISPGETCVDPNLILIPVPKYETQLSEAVFGTGVQKMETAVSSVFERLLRFDRYPMPREMSRYIQDVLCKMIQSAEFLHMEIREALILKVRTSLERQRNISDLLMETSNRMEEIAEAAAEARREHKETLIYKCMAYIDQHYMEDLSLESVAATFQFNPAYFSQYFKNKLNINFVQYLTQLRLSKARDLLEKTDEKVYQVAERLGYHDVKYFNRVFKKEFGITPEEYRSISRDMRRGGS